MGNCIAKLQERPQNAKFKQFWHKANTNYKKIGYLDNCHVATESCTSQGGVTQLINYSMINLSIQEAESLSIQDPRTGLHSLRQSFDGVSMLETCM
ncbi:hypothetical protein SS50377_26071 [Spironucleus salmonicida]|uniref:Uncharacterized protein n=1 Tax=Spironucleus salmonicida TaxID=348837 RepID=A0A9P8LP16_9EUKA|nr:hypothetical protein SS50377_26071 [Spironucleus salmonicida]